MWQFLVTLLLATLYPGSLLLPGVFGLVLALLAALLGTVLGDWVDRTPRMRGVCVCVYVCVCMCVRAKIALYQNLPRVLVHNCECSKSPPPFCATRVNVVKRSLIMKGIK